MNRQQRRATHKRKFEVGTMVRTQMFAMAGELYWFEAPEGFSPEDGLPPGVTIHGPFKTETDIEENQRLILFGPQCEVTHGGTWDPNWDKPQ